MKPNKMRRDPASLEPFQITIHIQDRDYIVEALDPDPVVAVKAFRLVKQGDEPAVYDVHIDHYGVHCDCPGHLRWETPCKHIRALRRAGMIEERDVGQRSA